MDIRYLKYRFTFTQDTIKNTGMYRILRIFIISLFISTTSLAGSDGQNELSKESNGQVKDCFEGINSEANVSTFEIKVGTVLKI